LGSLVPSASWWFDRFEGSRRRRRRRRKAKINAESREVVVEKKKR
jgi:hypothetical protein